MTTISNLPTPPSRSDPANFQSRGDAFMSALPQFVTEANAVANEVNSNATAAAASKVAAETAEDNAEVSAVSAVAAAASAQAAADAAAVITSKYLGVKTSDPTQDNSGGALAVGHWYWNSSTSKARIYTGSAWADAFLAQPDVVTTAGTQELTNKTLTGALIKGYKEKRVWMAAGTAFTIDPSQGSIFRCPTTGNATITLPASVDGISLTVEVAYGGAHTVTFNITGGATVKWVAGSQPSPTSVNGKRDDYVFVQDGTDTVGRDGGRGI